MNAIVLFFPFENFQKSKNIARSENYKTPELASEIHMGIEIWDEEGGHYRMRQRK